MSTLLFLQYNNYFNRTIKKHDTIDAYIDEVVNKYQYYNNINFNPNDDVDTEQIINWRNNWTPDYLLVIEDEENFTRWFITDWVRTRSNQYKVSLHRDVIADYNTEVLDSVVFVEKGFVKDSTDPMIHNKEGFIVNQIKKEETLLTDKSKCPWLVAYLAKEKVGTPITGQVKYIPAESPNLIKLSTSIYNWEFYKYSQNDTMTFTKDFTFKYFWKTPSNSKYVSRIEYKGGLDFKGGVDPDAAWAFNSNLIFQPTGSPGLGSKNWKKQTTDALSDYMNKLGYEEYILNAQSCCGMVSESDYNKLKEFDGKNIIDTQGKVFSVSVTDYLQSKEKAFEVTTNDNVHSLMSLAWNSIGGQAATTEPNDDAFVIRARNTHSVKVILVEQTKLEAQYDLSNPEVKTEDSPLYDMICIPYPNEGQTYKFYLKIDNVLTQFVANREWSMAVMQAIVRDGGADSGYIYDLQLVPYCPIQEAIQNSSLGYFQVNDNSNVITVTQNSNVVYAAFVVPKSTFTVDINKSVELPVKYNETYGNAPFAVSTEQMIMTTSATQTYTFVLPESYGEVTTGGRVLVKPRGTSSVDSATIMNYSAANRTITYRVVFGLANEGEMMDVTFIMQSIRYTKVSKYNNPVIDIKVANECDFYRLNSPNYNGQFEFNLVSNGNSVSGFHADCTYKPFTPYIQVHPYFKDLYGQDFEDARGLICGGDFSLGLLKDAYQVYEIQNKNYQNIFDRQIQNMDVNNKIAKQEATIQAIVGTMQGGATGAAAGAKAGPYGAAIGAAVGTTASAIGGAADIANLTKRQEEAKGYAIDNYNMNLQNIQALPLSITRTSAITANNKLFPFLEYFTCTDEEKDAFVNKMEYDGMTIGIISTVSEYAEEGQWFKGKLIRNESIKEDTHLFNTIYDELNKGVYL